MKRTIKILFVLVFVFSICYVNHCQGSVGTFNVTTNSTWKKYSKSSIKTDNLKTAVVNWQASSKSSHKQWFRIVNSKGEAKGESLHNYLQNKTFSTTAKKGYYYWIMTKREHIIDPSTQVTGRWEP
ncbi:MAG: hypothetical protein LBR15_02455 [Methanobrevibacter sp.]|jgi:hypothetical protein|nr:hypothetical protein [Candidatus Methanovirga australis]